MPSKNHFHIRTADEVVDTSVDIEVDVGTAADVEAVMRKYDRESNTRTWEGTPGIVVRVIMVIFSLYCIWSTLFSVAAIEKRLTAFIGCVIIMGYMTYPASKHHVRHNYIPWFDYVLMIVGAASFFYYCFAYDSLVMVLTSASKITPLQIAVGIIGILCLMELCRRCVGVPILCVAAALIIYTFAIGTPLKRVLYTLFYTTSGVMGTPIQVCAKYIVVFIIFGAFLERTGIAAFFIDLANSLVGRFSGGPAKVAVISSALCGMVSGSSVGNTVTTGSVTIPMMKKTGYKPEFAGAVEAAASTGGQIMPPIMGAAAFLMAEYMNVTYGEVALRAILPAVLYFTGIFIAVHLEAKKLRLSGIPKEELPVMSKLLRKIYLLLPLVVLVWLVTTNTRTMQFSATVAILVAIVVSLFDKDNRITPAKIFEALEAGGKGTITVAASPTPHAEILQQCVPILAEQGIDLQIHEYSDYVVPNTAVEDGDEDANYFQHVPYLDDFNTTRGTHLVSVTGVHIEPMGIYAGKSASLDSLPDGASVAVPNDATNEGRALLLLEAQGLIKLADDSNLSSTPKDIVENPKNLTFTEVEAATVPSIVSEVDIAVINSNYAMGAGFNPVEDALALEASDSPYVNVLVCKEGNENNEAIQALAEALHSDTVKNFITENYGGAVVAVD